MLSLIPWAEFRRAKGGVKAHVLLNHEDYLPSYVLISKAKLHDSRMLGLLRLPFLSNCECLPSRAGESPMLV